MASKVGRAFPCLENNLFIFGNVIWCYYMVAFWWYEEISLHNPPTAPTFHKHNDKISRTFLTCDIWSRAQAFRPESRAWSAVLRHIRLTRARVFTCRLHGAEWADPREALQVNMWAEFPLLYWNCRLRLSECLSNLNAAITKVWNVVQWFISEVWSCQPRKAFRLKSSINKSNFIHCFKHVFWRKA